MTDSTSPQATPKRRYRCPLDTLARVRYEMTKVYREARAGTTPIADMTRFIYALDRMARLTVDIEFEKRIEALEALPSPSFEHETDFPNSPGGFHS